MLHIVFSRAALFPWLGLVLMVAGGAFPDDRTVAMILVVIGANVAFYSLRDFSQNFVWGDNARAMLALCAVLFVLGLVLLALSTQFELQNRWLALLATGLYLCLFAIWMTQHPVGLGLKILAIISSVTLVLGVMLGHFGYQDWRVFAEAEQIPQEITLRDLQANGFGSNRYIRLKDFRFCAQAAAETPRKQSVINNVWYPLVPIDGQAVQLGGPAPLVPARIEVVAGYLSTGNQPKFAAPLPKGRERPVQDLLQKKREEDGYECTVITGLKPMKPEIREQLLELGPQTNVDEMIVLDWSKPPPASRVYGCLGVGGGVAVLSLLALIVVHIRARKIVRQPGWLEATKDDTADEPTTPS